MAILINFLYPAEPFLFGAPIPELEGTSEGLALEQIHIAERSARAAGMEMYQMNTSVSVEGVGFDKCEVALFYGG